MKIKELFRGTKKYFPLSVIFFLSAILLGILSPQLKSFKTENWRFTVDEKVKNIEAGTKKLFDLKQEKLINSFSSLKKELGEIDFSNSDFYDFIPKIDLTDNFQFAVLDSSFKLVYWSDFYEIPAFIVSEHSNNDEDTYFYRNFLSVNLCIQTTFIQNGKKFYLSAFTQIERKFDFKNNYFHKISFSSELEEKFLTGFEVFYAPFRSKSMDGRKHSFDILNNGDKKIGLITFTKPSLNTEIEEFSKRISVYQSILILIAALLFGFAVAKEINSNKSALIKFVSATVYYLSLRYLIYMFDITSLAGDSELNSPISYSSAFAGGIVSTPIEFVITAIFILLIAISGIRFYIGSNISFKRIPLYSKILFLTGLLFAFPVSLRGLTAVFRSLVFDSSIRYFKDSTIIPDLTGIVMNFGILIAAFSFFLIFLVIFSAISRLLFSIVNIPANFRGITLAIISAITGSVYLMFEDNPLFNFQMMLITVIFVTFICIKFIEQKDSFTQLIVFNSIFASIFSIILLIHINTELEKNSLKKTVDSLLLQDENFLRFLVQQTLISAVQSEDVNNIFGSDDSKASAAALNVWSASPLQGEGVHSFIGFYSREMKLEGSFSAGMPVNLSLPVNFKSGNVTDMLLTDGSNVLPGYRALAGIIPVRVKDFIKGYIVVIAGYPGISLPGAQLPKFLQYKSNVVNDVLNLNELIIMQMIDQNLTVHSGKFNQTATLVPFLEEKLKGKSENFFTFENKGKRYLFYGNLILNEDGENVITVAAVLDKGFVWILFNFFKLFILHAIYIFIFFVIIVLIRFKEFKELIFSFRTQLLGGFLITSIIPLIALAVYNRQNLETRAMEFNSNDLSQRIIIVENLIENYSSSNPFFSTTDLFKLVRSSVDIPFLIYEGSNLINKESNQVYSSGLVPPILNFEVYYELITKGNENYFKKIKLDNFEFNTYYSKLTLRGKGYIIGVNDALDSGEFSFSAIEFDVFLFGVYSFAIILVIVLGAFISGRLSAPIRKLTNATRAVAQGDLSVSLEIRDKGEIKELVEGFNQMTEELKKSQEELASLEREAAWKEMAKQVAHEIKNPLTPMKLSVQHLLTVIKLKKPGTEKLVEKVLDTILKQIEVLNQTASEFSRFARMPNLTLAPLDLLSTINEIKYLYNEENVTVCVKTELENCLILADESNLKRSLINLVRNSLQSGAHIIDLNLELSGENYILTVTDDGSGIKPEYQEHIFEKDFTTKTSGMGIGLKITKRFFEAISGSIILVTSKPGETIFKISIPVYNEKQPNQ